MSPITMYVPIPTTDTGHPLKPGTQHNLFQDSKPEERKAATPEGHVLEQGSEGMSCSQTRWRMYKTSLFLSSSPSVSK